MTQDNGNLKRQFMNLLRGSREQAVEVAEEIRESATRLRDRLDEEKSLRERKRLLSKLGKSLYADYREGTWTPPDSVRKLIEELDALPDPYGTSDPDRDETLERLADTADSVIRGVASGVGAWLSDARRTSAKSAEESADEPAEPSPPDPSPAPEASSEAKKPQTRRKSATEKKSDAASKAQSDAPRTGRKTSRNSVLPKDPLEDLKDDPKS